MCLSAPKIPPPPPPPAPVQTPDSAADLRKARQGAAGYGGGSVLTGTQGVAAGSLNTGGSTLLGG